MNEKIQLPFRYYEVGDGDTPIRSNGIYVIQMPNAIAAGYPIEYRHSHKEWLFIERFGLIKIGLTRNFAQDRMAALSLAAGRYHIIGDFKSPTLNCVGFAQLSYFKQAIEKWIHHSLNDYRIPQVDMFDLGREWFIPTDTALNFLNDTFAQINTSDLAVDSDVFALSKRLAQIRQSHFGGLPSEPKFDKVAFQRFHVGIQKQKEWLEKLAARKAERAKYPGGFSPEEAHFFKGFLSLFKPKEE